MKRIMTIATAATLSLGLVVSAASSANAGKRERNILLGVGLGIVGTAIVAGEIARSKERRRARERARVRAYQQPTPRYNHGGYQEVYADDYERPRHRRVYRERRTYREPAYAGYGSDHIDWCFDRYRSYRASDNTYQPYHGGRRQCISPNY